MGDLISSQFDPHDPDVMNKSWRGLFDIADKTWIGTEKGPLLYDDPELAQVAAQIIAKRLGFSMLRIQVKPWPGDAWVKKDDLQIVMSGEAAIKHLEDGGI